MNDTLHRARVALGALAPNHVLIAVDALVAADRATWTDLRCVTTTDPAVTLVEVLPNHDDFVTTDDLYTALEELTAELESRLAP